MELEENGKIIPIKVDDSPVYIDPNIKHRMIKETSGESRSIVILIPGSNTFPKGLINEQW